MYIRIYIYVTCVYIQMYTCICLYTHIYIYDINATYSKCVVRKSPVVHHTLDTNMGGWAHCILGFSLVDAPKLMRCMCWLHNMYTYACTCYIYIYAYIYIYIYISLLIKYYMNILYSSDHP